MDTRSPGYWQLLPLLVRHSLQCACYTNHTIANTDFEPAGENRWIRADMNWNLVSNGALAIAAVALGDVPHYAAAARQALYAAHMLPQHLPSVLIANVCGAGS